MSILDLKTQLIEGIAVSLKSLDLPQDNLHLERPKSQEFGDFSCNAALILAKKAKLTPLRLAQKIIQNLDILKTVVDEISVTPPGFINFTLSKDFLRSEVRHILQVGEAYGQTSHGKGKSALVEFVSANPTGPLTVGHGRQAVLGDIVSRILEWHGYDVTREYYFNNAGRQIRLLAESVYARYMGLLGETMAIPEGGYEGNYITEIAENIYNEHGSIYKKKADNPIFKNTAVQVIFNDIKSTLSNLGIKFDEFVNEKSFYENNRINSIIDRLREQDLVFDEDGATWFATTKLGKEKNTVLIKSSGEPTYRLPDIAYHEYKMERNFDLLVDIFGADHKDTYPDVLSALKSLGYNTDIIRVLIHQFVTLKKGGEKVKMSTRKATYVTLEDLIDKVGTDVVRYFFIMRNMKSHLNFDMTLAVKESDENPVFYLQYAHARICNIIKYADAMGIPYTQESDLRLISHPSEFELIRELIRFPEVMKSALECLEPQVITNYLQALATKFHKFYTECRVVTEDKKLSQARLVLITAVKYVLANGLSVLGISQPERM
ncbi:MAG: arginine--tRNA ligase [Candidatus Marinimicrobia bacterium]|nr:arginine--tRNA ligase [Candidatus Neomarinimicrobiota bacterium]